MGYRNITVKETRDFTYLLQQNWPAGAEFSASVVNGCATIDIRIGEAVWTGEGMDMRTAEWEAWKAYERG